MEGKNINIEIIQLIYFDQSEFQIFYTFNYNFANLMSKSNSPYDWEHPAFHEPKTLLIGFFLPMN